MPRGRLLAALAGAAALALSACQPKQAGDGNIAEPIASNDDGFTDNMQAGDGDFAEPMAANGMDAAADNATQAGDGDVAEPIDAGGNAQ